MQLHQQATNDLLDWVKNIETSGLSSFEKQEQLATKLGATYQNGLTTFGFWAPELSEQHIANDKVFLEVFTPLTEVNFRATNQKVTFRRDTVHLIKHGDFYWGVVEGVKAGNKNDCGSLYWIKYKNKHNQSKYIIDYLSNSIPYGIYSPAEVYDLDTMFAQRSDTAYFKNITPNSRLPLPSNILQVHPQTATNEKTLEGISNTYNNLKEKINGGKELSKNDKPFLNYDAVQLLPVMPMIEYEKVSPFFKIVERPSKNETVAELRKFDITNWGYDIAIAAASAVNPGVLGSGRPNELLELIETLHNFEPKPIKLILDIVYGHVDNQGERYLHPRFLSGSGLYGKEINFNDDTVRAMLLESQRRILRYGFDGFRVDASQDITRWDESGKKKVYDDEYVDRMNTIPARVGDLEYLPFMIYEDGRPWPRDDWNISATYLEVHKRNPNAAQWNPLAFANNKAYQYGFWVERFWRVREIANQGSRWATGLSNHDSLRSPSHNNPKSLPPNTALGSNLPEVVKRAYNNPVSRLLDYGFMPGQPMEFINASAEAPWTFYRNWDDTYGVKIFIEEGYFWDWFVRDSDYKDHRFFKQLKEKGYNELGQVMGLLHGLRNAMNLVGYRLDKMLNAIKLKRRHYPIPTSADDLKAIARAYMADVHEFCNIQHHIDALDSSINDFNYEIRSFRQQQQWLRQDLKDNDFFDFLPVTDAAVIYYGQRSDGDKTLYFVGNMEGIENEVNVYDLFGLDPTISLNIVLKTPFLNDVNFKSLKLKGCEGVVFGN